MQATTICQMAAAAATTIFTLSAVLCNLRFSSLTLLYCLRIYLVTPVWPAGSLLFCKYGRISALPC